MVRIEIKNLEEVFARLNDSEEILITDENEERVDVRTITKEDFIGKTIYTDQAFLPKPFQAIEVAVSSDLEHYWGGVKVYLDKQKNSENNSQRYKELIKLAENKYNLMKMQEYIAYAVIPDSDKINEVVAFSGFSFNEGDHSLNIFFGNHGCLLRSLYGEEGEIREKDLIHDINNSLKFTNSYINSYKLVRQAPINFELTFKNQVKHM